MKVIRQTKEGSLVIDGEGEMVNVTRRIPGNCPAILVNFRVQGQEVEKDVEHPVITTGGTDNRSQLVSEQEQIDRLTKRVSNLEELYRNLDTRED